MRIQIRSASRLVSVVIAITACSSSPKSEGGRKSQLAPIPTWSGGALPPPAPPATPSEAPPKAPQPGLYVGRFDTTDPAGPKASWPGSRILARFDGTEVSVTLKELNEPWMDGAPSYWDVSIDHGEVRPLEMVPDGTVHVFSLASNLKPGPHDVELYKRTEARTGITQFLGFDYHGGKALEAPKRQARRIEVIGDSQSSGYGIEAVGTLGSNCPDETHWGSNENFHKSWGARLGATFDAEVHGIVYADKGFTVNALPSDPDLLKSYYPRANPDPTLREDAPLFDMQSWIPDVIILMQGGVDFANGDTSYDDFRTAYRDFVIKRLRARGPNIHIFMGVLGDSGRREIPLIARELVADLVKDGDDKLHVFIPNFATSGEMMACKGHGTPAFHERIANELSTSIRGVVGW